MYRIYLDPREDGDGRGPRPDQRHPLPLYHPVVLGGPLLGVHYRPGKGFLPWEEIQIIVFESRLPANLLALQYRVVHIRGLQ